MLRKLPRIFALALLVLAVPVQGMASVAAGQCMTFGHHQDAGAQDHAHEHGAAGADHHDHAAQPDEQKRSHCGPCTACCASASMAAPAAPAILAVPSFVEYLFSALAPPGAEPHRFDRPPLSI
jgi:hypothetical protein